MHEVRRDELGEERGHDVAEEHDAFGDEGADEIEGSREDYYVEDIVYEACVLHAV
jgi:hypothetical protein